MMVADVARETKSGPIAAKTTVLDAAVASLRADLDPHASALNSRAREVAAADSADAIGNLAPALAEQVSLRSHGIVILAELMTFHPWTGKHSWTKNTRTNMLEVAATDLACLRPDDYAAMTREFDALMKAVRRKNIKWGRVAVISAAGIGLGVATGGLAAPAIGGAVGGAMGLTGAAATSAGLAALGGGSIAAGGFGVAGGTLIISTAGGLLGAGLAATSARYLASTTIAAEAIKLDLVTRMVAADTQNQDEMMRRVVESLQDRLNDVTGRVGLLTDKIATLKAELKAAKAENAALKAELARLTQDKADAENAKTMIEVIIDRMPDGARSGA